MLVSHRKKFIFTKTVKTAGTSVESYFEKYCMPEGEWVESGPREEYVSETGIIGYRGAKKPGKTWQGHMSAQRIRDLIGPETWQDYFKFTVVRNPFDKLVSGYYLFVRQKVIAIDEGLSDIENFRRWIQGGGVINDRDKYLIDGEECVDYFIRYEKLQEGIEEVCNRLSISYDPSSIPEFKKGIRSHEFTISEFYDEKTARMVEDKYAWEMERFAYRLPE